MLGRHALRQAISSALLELIHQRDVDPLDRVPHRRAGQADRDQCDGRVDQIDSIEEGASQRKPKQGEAFEIRYRACY
jgi:hypothetical protein